MKQGLIYFFLLFAPAWAEPEVRMVIFHSDPPGAQGNITLRPQNPTGLRVVLLSADGKACAVPVHALPRDTAKVDLTFQLPGCANATRQVDQGSFASDKLQVNAEGVYIYPEIFQLAPTSWWWWARYHPAVSGLALGLLAAAGLALVLSRRKLHSEQRRQEQLTQVIGHADARYPLIGKIIGPYLVVDKLGQGGFAAVYKALPKANLEAQEAVAIKVIAPELEDVEFRDRFLREIKVTSALKHPNIVKVLDWGEHEGLLYLVMELVEGKPLPISAGGLPPSLAAARILPVLRALEYAHRQGIVHRDIKPDNVLVSASEKVTLMDFGIARGHRYKTITATGNAVGTPAYMAPEQFMGGVIDSRADQYALGVMLFEMLCGRQPFGHDDPMELLRLHLTEQLPDLDAFKPGIAPEWNELVHKMTEKSPAARYQDLAEVLALVERLEGL